MGPQNHIRDALVAECERLWQFFTKSYVKRASLLDEKQQVDAEKAGVKSKTHQLQYPAGRRYQHENRIYS